MPQSVIQWMEITAQKKGNDKGVHFFNQGKQKYYFSEESGKLEAFDEQMVKSNVLFQISWKNFKEFLWNKHKRQQKRNCLNKIVMT